MPAMNKHRLRNKKTNRFNTRKFSNNKNNFLFRMKKELKKEEKNIKKLNNELNNELNNNEVKRFSKPEDIKKEKAIKNKLFEDKRKVKTLRDMINEEEEKTKNIDIEEKKINNIDKTLNIRDLISKLEDEDFSSDED